MPYKDLAKRAEYSREHSTENMRRWRSKPENLSKERKRLRDYNRYRKDRVLFLNRRRFKVHGITQERYEAKIVFQNNLCAICFKEMEPPNIDHNHKTSEVRDLLCRYCNTLLGMAFEDTKILQSAIDYIKRHQVESQPRQIF
jgi:formylmethanofuran dehydrogenase subunit E